MKLTDTQKDKMTTHGIPDYMQNGIVRYYENGDLPGDFLSAVINNDLKGAFGHADDVNANCLRAYVMWFYNEAPSGSWGYASAVKDWLDRFSNERETAA